MEPNAPCIPGPWCKDGWCNARRSCGALAAYNNDTAQGMFTAVEPAAVSLPDAKDMPPEMRAKVLERFGLIKSWYTEIYDHEYSLAMRGNNTWGKLVKGRGSRGWADESVATAQLNTLLHGEIYDKKLKTPAKAEAALKAQGMKAKNAKAAVADLVETKPGSPTLVSLDAPGTSVAVVDGMFGAIA